MQQMLVQERRATETPECTQKYHRRFQAVEGMCFADGCPQRPILNMLHIPLEDTKAKTCVFNDAVHCEKRAWHLWGDKWLGCDVYLRTPKTMKKLKKEVFCETFSPTIQLTMEYNERDVSDDAQIVEEDEND